MSSHHDQQNESMRRRSEEVTSDCRLTAFLYDLMRDHVPPGKVEEIVRSLFKPGACYQYTNGWLALYAADLAARIKEPNPDEDL